MCCVTLPLPIDVANDGEGRRGRKLAIVSASERSCALMSAANCNDDFAWCHHAACMQIAIAMAIAIDRLM